MKKILLFAVVSVLIISVSITTISAQSNGIPSWIKNTALWWDQDQISDDDFLAAMQFLIKEGILVIPEEPQSQIDPPSLQLDAGPSDNTIDTTSNCDESYPDVCIPPHPPDLNCGDIGYSNFRVIGNDPHGFDRDNDGIGCES